MRDDHPLVMGMTGFWGTELVNQTCSERRLSSLPWAPASKKRIVPAGIPATPSTSGQRATTQGHSYRHRTAGNRAQLPDRNRCGCRCESRPACADRVAQEMYPDGFDARKEGRDRSTSAKRSKRQTPRCKPQRLPDDAGTHPCDTRIALARRCDYHHGCGWNKNGVGQQFDILTPGSILTPGGFATMGFGLPRHWRETGSTGSCGLCPGWRRWLRPKPVDAGHCGGTEPRDCLAGDEQQRLWHHRRPAKGALRPDLWDDLPRSPDAPTNGPGYAEIARAYGAEGMRIRQQMNCCPRCKRPLPAASRQCWMCP